MSLLFEPGLFTSTPVQTAAVIGGAAAIVSAVVGVFTVIRGQAFAGHALADVSSAGGAASFLLGISPLLGFFAMGAIGAAGVELARARQPRERDLVTGIALGAGLGLTALLLHLDVTTHSTTGAAVTVMFGSMFAIPGAMMLPAVAVTVIALCAVAALYRPLLLSSLEPELATVRGAPVLMTGLVHLVVLALAVALSALTVGAILSTALLIGPPAAALRIASRPGPAVLAAVVIGLGATWGGIVIAYDSYDWIGGRSWPVSFCIVALIFLIYLASVRIDRH
jgi:zinc/manganese transport system permease protein